MKKKIVKRKKLALGTGKNGLVRHYIESPNETITESQIAMARAQEKAANNPWAKGLDIFGNMAMQYGLNMTGGTSGAAKGIGEGFGNIFGSGAQMKNGGPVGDPSDDDKDPINWVSSFLGKKEKKPLTFTKSEKVLNAYGGLETVSEDFEVPDTREQYMYPNSVSTKKGDKVNFERAIKDKTAQEFLNRYNNEWTRTKLGEQTDLSPEDIDNMILQGLSVKKVIGGNEKGSKASVNRDSKTINIGKEFDGVPGVETHERVHVSNFDAAQGENLLKVLGNPFKQEGKNTFREVKNYMKKSHEAYGNFSEFREKLGIKPGQQLTKKQLQKLVKDKNLGEENFYKVFNDDNIVEALNTIASTSSNKDTKNIAAMGGKVGSLPVEVEGKEVAETPDGQFIEFKGASHENGGIDVDLPVGTEIFSKRIKVEGKSMAERKKLREKKAFTLESLLEKSGNDKILKDTLKRTKNNNKIQEDKDQTIQDIIGQAQERTKQIFALGGKVKGVNELTPFGNTELSTDKSIWSPTMRAYAESIGAVSAGPTEGNTNIGLLTGSLDLSRNPTTAEGEGLPGEGLNLPNFTGGDLVGLAGTLYSAFKPMENTLANRAGDTPNINAFEDFGNDALDTMDSAKGYVGVQRDNALNELESDRTRAITNNRKSARGINTSRALDLASEANATKAKGDIYSRYAEQMMGLLSQEAGFENQQDAQVMAGEATRDDNDRRDRDNFYSQMGQDIATKGEGIQTIGKMLNQNKANTVAEGAINDSSQNFKYTNGVLTDKGGNKVMTQVELQKAAANIGVTVEQYIEMLNKQ